MEKDVKNNFENAVKASVNSLNVNEWEASIIALPYAQGSELNSLVEKYIFKAPFATFIPDYSGDIKLAFTVATILRKFRKLSLEVTAMPTEKERWWVKFSDSVGQIRGQEYSSTVARGICLAAL
jgi:hypothetical protein